MLVTIRILIAISIGLMSACASVDYADTATENAAKSFAVPADMAQIYVYRDDNVVINTAISVSIDGEPVGTTGNNTFLRVRVAPGAHTIVAKGENTDELTVDAKAGSNVFVQIGVGLGVVTNRARLMLMNDDAGKEAVLNTRLIE